MQQRSVLRNTVEMFNRMTYNMERKEHKINLFTAFFILFKSTVGLGLFSYPNVFGKVGIGYGITLGAFICYITTYGIFILAHLSNLIEKNDLRISVTSYDRKILSSRAD